MEESVKEKTGKELSEWHRILEKSKLEKHREMLNYLKDEYGLTYGYANLIALKFRKADAGSHDAVDLIQEQYRSKPDMYPVYQELDAFILSLGKDITVSPKKAAVSYIRKNQFALIKPATKSRIDLGLKIKGQKPTGKLEDSGPFGTMCTHRIQLQNKSDLDSEVRNWIKKAYTASS